MHSTIVKKAFLILSAVMVITAGCDVTVKVAPPTSPTPLPTATLIPATSTLSVVPARTDAVPAEVQLNGTTLVVGNASFSECELPNCPASGAGRRYLSVPLQGLNVPSDQFLDYKNMPEGIAIRDNTGTNTPYNDIYAYTPTTHVLTLYFAIPENATVFVLQWPGANEVPLLVVSHEAATPQPLSYKDIEVDQFQIVVPPEVAGGIHGNQIPRAEGADVPAWGRTPGHIEMQLESYILQGRFHEPRIYVYPALEYAQMLPAAFESIHRLDNILYPPGGPDLNNPLPAIPFFNDQQVFASNVKVISFQNGQGVRFLTQYAQYSAPANNRDLFYEFQGVTRDGAYYIVAILPIRNPMLAETSDAGAPLPVGGVPYSYMIDPNTDMQLYYRSVTDVLNATPADTFTPTLNQLDQLIQSMSITP
jgi:hypothetical protein